jgi:hypothetical protein
MFIFKIEQKKQIFLRFQISNFLKYHPKHTFCDLLTLLGGAVLTFFSD